MGRRFRGAALAMCGLVGILGDMAHAEADIQTMLSAIHHRGPDDSGVWIDKSNNVALGHARLSIVDLSDAGKQPMVSHGDRYVIAYNGEIYNHEDIRKRLPNSIPWRGHSDTETLVAAIEEWGIEKALSQVEGMFAFALWDKKTGQLSLARDRAGEKPLYYGFQKGRLYFTSELSALSQLKRFEKNLSLTAASLMLNYKYVPSPYSIYEDIKKLPPGSFLVVNNIRSEPEVKQYWSAVERFEHCFTHPTDLTGDAYLEKLEELISHSVKSQLMGDVPVGAFLSGGIDSSLIAALMQRACSSPINTFSIGFGNDKFNEAPHAKKIAQHLGTNHTEMYVYPEDLQAVIPKLPTIYDEPFSDVSQVPTYLLSHLARQQVTVALSGDAGDELFCGYDRYHQTMSIWRKLNRIPKSVRAKVAPLLASLPAVPFNATASLLLSVTGKQNNKSLFGDKMLKAVGLLSSDTIDDLYNRHFTQWDNIEALVKNSDNPLTVMNTTTLSGKIDDDDKVMMLKDFCFYLPNDILTKVDRASMAVSLESRIPLLNKEVIEFAWSTPTTHLTNAAGSKLPLKHILYKHVPQQLVDRPKMGFGVPISDWLKGPLQEWMMDTLNSQKLEQAGIVNSPMVQKRMEEHIASKRQWSESIWNLLMFQTWHDEIF